LFISIFVCQTIFGLFPFFSSMLHISISYLWLLFYSVVRLFSLRNINANMWPFFFIIRVFGYFLTVCDEVYKYTWSVCYKQNKTFLIVSREATEYRASWASSCFFAAARDSIAPKLFSPAGSRAGLWKGKERLRPSSALIVTMADIDLYSRLSSNIWSIIQRTIFASSSPPASTRAVHKHAALAPHRKKTQFKKVQTKRAKKTVA